MTEKQTLPQKPSAQKHQNRLSKRFNGISLLIIGCGIGWLAGLSVSPVVSTIITSIVGVTVTLISVLSGLQHHPAQSEEEAKPQVKTGWTVNPLPIALLMIGILLGSTLGIAARTRNWLGGTESRRDVRAEIQRWKDVGLAEKEVVQRLFDLEYAPQAEVSKDAEQPTFKQSVLFGSEYEECEDLVRRSPEQLATLLKDSENEIFKQLPDIIQDPETLKRMVEILCEKFGQ